VLIQHKSVRCIEIALHLICCKAKALDIARAVMIEIPAADWFPGSMAGNKNLPGEF
jgi:hypothetical protein